MTTDPAATGRRRSPRRRTAFALAGALASCGLAVAALEVTLRVLGQPAPVRVGWRVFRDHFRPPQETNDLGFRGQPVAYGDQDQVILLVGDSQVEAVACAYEWMPERRLEHYLSEQTGKPVRVFTVGCAGHGQDQQLLAVREYFARFRADRVVAWLTITNDVKDNTWPTSMPIDGVPKPTFWLEGGRLRGPNHPMDAVLTSRVRVLALLQKMLAGSLDARWERDHLPEPYRPLEGHTGPVRTEWQEHFEPGRLHDEAMRREKSDKALLLAPQSARTRYGVILTNRLLAAMRAEAAAHGAAFTLFAVDKGDRTDAIDGVYLYGEDRYRVSSEQFWANVRQMAEGFDLHLLPVREPRWQVGPLDHHLNEHATDDVMRELAGILAREM